MEEILCVVCNKEPVKRLGNVCQVCLEGKPANLVQTVETPEEKGRNGFSKQFLDLLCRYPEIVDALEKRAHDQIRTMAEQLVWELREVLK